MPIRSYSIGLMCLLAACATVPPGVGGPGFVKVEARPVLLNPADPAQLRVGRLRFLGGLQLQSADPRFGGLSGLRWHGGQLYAVSDAGDWFVLNALETGDRLTGMGQVRVSRLVDEDGDPIKTKARGDAEALNFNYGECQAIQCPPESVSIAFERDHRVWTYMLEDGMPRGRPSAMAAATEWLHQLPANGGLEAMAGVGGLWLMIAEQLRTASGAASALVFHNGLDNDGDADRWQRSEVPVTGDFSPTDADYLDGRDFLVLFRRYSLMHGVGARIDRVSVVRGRAGDPRIVAEELAELSPPLNLDNMEGLAVRHEDDRIFVYLVSDDNFSGAQRTLLMKFELLPK